MPDNRDELDRLLDSALASYADPGPDSGLESRILSRIAVERIPAPRRRWLPWAIAVPATATLLVFILLSHHGTKNSPAVPPQAHVTHRSVTHSIEAANRPSSEPALIRRSHAPLRKGQSHHKALAGHSAPLPKLDIFPTPQPLSPEEQALVNFAAHATEAERQSLVTAQQQADAPLRISAIQIEPLQSPSAGAN